MTPAVGTFIERYYGGLQTSHRQVLAGLQLLGRLVRSADCLAQLSQLSFIQLHGSSCNIFLKVLNPRRPGNWEDDWRAP